MQQIINFLIRNKHFFLFAFLLALSLAFTIQSHSYHRSRFVNSANFFSGGVYTSVSNLQNYFKLTEYNEQLLQENASLRERLQDYDESKTTLGNIDNIKNAIEIDSANQYQFIPAQVINNSYSKADNFITIRGGKNDSIQRDLGVITSKGIVGITDKSSSDFCTVLSMLNSNFTTNAKLKSSEHFGTVQWDGKDPNRIQIIDMQQQAPVKIGDTIETSGKSAIFPKGIPIGTIESFDLDQSKNFYILSVKLLNDMTSLGHVYVIKNKFKDEIKALENRDNE